MDMLVKLYDICNMKSVHLSPDIKIVRAMPSDKHKVVRWVRENFDEGWASECEVSFSNRPITCYIAVKNNTEILGFACCEATCKGFFGPTGVGKSFRGKGIGRALLLQAMYSMWEMGYAYAIIGSADKEAVSFYQKTVSATIIDDSEPGIYANTIG